MARFKYKKGEHENVRLFEFYLVFSLEVVSRTDAHVVLGRIDVVFFGIPCV